MKQRIFTLLSAFSLFFCIAIVACWIDSYITYDEMRIRGSDGRVYCIDSYWGAARLRTYVSSPADRNRFIPFHASQVPPELHDRLRATTKGQWLGFGRDHQFDSPIVPHWFPALLSAILPALWMRASVRRRTRKKWGLCIHCGYDIRFSANRCPECGVPITKTIAT